MPLNPKTEPWTRLDFTLRRYDGRPLSVTFEALFDGPLTWYRYRSDASERCAICRGRVDRDGEPYYVGRTGVLTDEGLPERIPADVVARFGFMDRSEKRPPPRFNIAPSQEILIIVQQPGRPAAWL